MRAIGLRLLMFVIAIAMDASGWGAGGGSAASIVGTWTCQMTASDGTPAGQGSLTFTADGLFQTTQGTWNYELTGDGQLIVSGGGGQGVYQVDALTETTLVFRYSDGSSFSCQRSQGGTGTGAQGGGQTSQLYGNFCTFSGSSFGGTYGRLTVISFDGRGKWSTGSETYSSGSEGTFYGTGGGERGTYSVQGDTIYYTTPDGYRGTAQVYVRQPSGEITEIMVDGVLYAKAVCEE